MLLLLSTPQPSLVLFRKGGHRVGPATDVLTNVLDVDVFDLGHMLAMGAEMERSDEVTEVTGLTDSVRTLTQALDSPKRKRIVRRTVQRTTEERKK